jgi:nucleoside-diphosphate-sugar epimerase
MKFLILNTDYPEFLCWLYAQHSEMEKADLTKARQILGSEPKVSYDYEEGFKRTIDWYFANKNKEEVKANMNKLLMER